MPEARLVAAGMDGRDDAGVAGELACGVKVVDGADLPVDEDGQDVSNAGKALEQLDGGGQSNSFPDADFELSDLQLQSVESVEFLATQRPVSGGSRERAALSQALPAPTKMSLCSVLVMPYSLAPPATPSRCPAGRAGVRYWAGVSSPHPLAPPASAGVRCGAGVGRGSCAADGIPHGSRRDRVPEIGRSIYGLSFSRS